MIIIDSPAIRFLLPGEVQENLSIFSNHSSADRDDIASKHVLHRASTRRTVDWCATWRRVHAAVFARSRRPVAGELCHKATKF